MESTKSVHAFKAIKTIRGYTSALRHSELLIHIGYETDSADPVIVLKATDGSYRAEVQRDAAESLRTDTALLKTLMSSTLSGLHAEPADLRSALIFVAESMAPKSAIVSREPSSGTATLK